VEWPISRGVTLQPIKTPTVVKLPQGVRIASISCGRSHAIGLSTEGKVYHWNHIKKVQEILLPNTSSRVIQVSGNWGYSSLLTASGEIFIVPQPENAEDDEEPILTTQAQGYGITLQTYISDAQNMGKEVSVVPDDKFVQIAAMESDTLVLSKKGKVYKFGTAQLIERETEEEEEELGEGPPVFLSNPAATGGELPHYSSPDPSDIIDSDGTLTMFISAFYHNFAIYTVNGAVILGTNQTGPDDQPTTRQELNNNICKVTFGDYHSGALTNDGDLLTWGSYSRGALGHGSAGLPRRNIRNRFEMMAPEPEISPRKIEALQDMFVFAASFGGWHSACLAFRR
jgi:SCF-associated factor 1